MRTILAYLALACTLSAAINVNSIGEINASGGNAQNSGIFSWGNANLISNWTTDTNTGNTSSPVLSSATYSFVAGDDEHWIFIKSGTNWYANCFYRIDSVSGGKATLDAAIGNGVCLDSTKGMPSPRFVASTSAGVASVGTPTSGTGGVVYSKNTSSFSNGTDLASSTGTTNPCTVTSAGGAFGANLVGNTIRISAGTSWTTGYYEIVSQSGGTLTLDRACGSSASISSGTWRIGGAFQMGNSLDDTFFENFSGTNGTGSGRVMIKSGTHSPNGAISIAAAGGTQAPVIIEGFNSLWGDAPTGTSRPLISMSGNGITLGNSWEVYNTRITGSPAVTLVGATRSKIVNCQVLNTSTTAARSAISNSSDGKIIDTEAVSLRGYAITLGASANQNLIGVWAHSSDVGIRSSASGGTAYTIINSLVEDNVTAAVQFSAALTAGSFLSGNTIVGAPNQRGIGISLATGIAGEWVFLNNIISGFSTGINNADTQTIFYSNYNDFYNNGTDRSGVATGNLDAALDPQFTSVSQVTDTGATSSGAVLTASGAKDLSGVVAGRDYLYIATGAGVTSGMYDIASVNDGADTVTSNLTIGTGSGITWSIVYGRNYAIGTNLKALGFGGFQGGYTTSYVDIGGVQRQESGGSGGTRVYVGSN